MRKIMILSQVSLLAGALALGTASAAPAPKSSSAKSAKSATTSAAKTKAPATHSVSGTLESYDASGKTVTVKGTKDTWTLGAADARVWDGSKSVGLDDLSSRTGAKVTVKYTEAGGQKSASSIRLAAAHHAKSASKSK